MLDKIHVPEADGMPLERWTAYMYSTAASMGLSKGQFYLGKEDGKSYIYKGQLETISYPHDFNPLKDEPFNKYRIETNE